MEEDLEQRLEDAFVPAFGRAATQRLSGLDLYAPKTTNNRGSLSRRTPVTHGNPKS